MAEVRREAMISASVDTVWPVLADFAGTDRWNPLVPRSFAVSERTTGVGARRRCEFDGQGEKWLEEEIVAFDEEARSYTMRIVGGTEKPPVDDVRVTISAAPAPSGRTRVTMRAKLVGRGLGQRAAAVVGSLVLGRVLTRLLTALDSYVTDAEPAQPGGAG